MIHFLLPLAARIVNLRLLGRPSLKNRDSLPTLFHTGRQRLGEVTLTSRVDLMITCMSRKWHTCTTDYRCLLHCCFYFLINVCICHPSIPVDPSSHPSVHPSFHLFVRILVRLLRIFCVGWHAYPREGLVGWWFCWIFNSKMVAMQCARWLSLSNHLPSAPRQVHSWIQTAIS